MGIYVHVPFCARHCPYCDFAVVVTARPPFEEFTAAILAELAADSELWSGRTLQSVYFGGGTPSMLPPQMLRLILDTIRSLYPANDLLEVTIEANPEHASSALLDAWRESGVTRVSWGVQSLDSTTLKTLGRAHTPEQAESAVQSARAAGFAHISADLIFAVPGRTLADTIADARALAGLGGLDHISSYELTWEPHTSMTRRLRAGALKAHDEDDRIEIFDGVRAELRSAGFERYEVSNFARPGGRSLHNASYWLGHEYAGIGPGAHGMRIDTTAQTVGRAANTPNLRRYLLDAGAASRTSEELDARTHLGECAMLMARTADGLTPASLGARFGVDLTALLGPLCARWAADGLGTWDGTRFSPSDSGFDLADTLAVQILKALDLQVSR